MRGERPGLEPAVEAGARGTARRPPLRRRAQLRRSRGGHHERRPAGGPGAGSPPVRGTVAPARHPRTGRRRAGRCGPGRLVPASARRLAAGGRDDRVRGGRPDPDARPVEPVRAPAHRPRPRTPRDGVRPGDAGPAPHARRRPGRGGAAGPGGCRAARPGRRFRGLRGVPRGRTRARVPPVRGRSRTDRDRAALVRPLRLDQAGPGRVATAAGPRPGRDRPGRPVGQPGVRRARGLAVVRRP